MKRSILFVTMMASMLFGQWEPVQLLPFEGVFSGFHMLDTANVEAIFYRDSSSVVRSSDGGRSWSVKHRIDAFQARNVSYVDENNIFISAEAASTFKRSSDGGESWSPVILPDRFTKIVQIQFVDSTHGFVIATAVDNSKNIILKTTNSGSNWSLLDTTIYWLYKIDFKSRLVGWVFASSVYKTTDGGATFTSQYIPYGFPKPSSITVYNDSIMFLGGGKRKQPSPWEFYDIPMLAVSTNNGVGWNWIHDFEPQQIRGVVDKIIFLDANRAVARLDHRGILYTTNQGVSWYPGTYPVQHYKYQDMMAVDNRLYGCAAGSVFIASQQNITSVWELRFNQTMTSCVTAAFIDPDYAILGTASSGIQTHKIFITTDRGKNWEAKDAPWGVSKAIEPVGDSVLYFATSDAIYKGDLKCENVTLVHRFTGVSLKNIHITPEGYFWVCAGKSLLRSTDGGATWATLLTVSDNNFEKLEFLDNGTGYALNGKIYKSTNHGETWSLLGFQPQYLASLDFYDSKSGLVTGSGGSAYVTHDGGIYFEEVIVPGLSNVSSGYCKDSLNWFIGAGNLFSTYDGGASWKKNDFPEPYYVKSFLKMHMYDHFEGIFVGNYIEVWRTSNRGNTPVELSGFSAVSLGNKVALQWTTETETNNMGFEIERRYKHGEWNTIAFSKGSGTSTKRIYYGYDDHEPKAPAILYYRLKQIDYDGRFSYSNEIEVILGEVPENYSINQNYPNPFNPSTKVSFSLPEENEVVIRVFSTMGELVKEINRGILPHGYFDQEIEMGDSPSGIYFCQVFCTNTVSGRTKSLTTKMVLMK